MALIGGAAFAESYAALIGFFAVSTMCYAALSTMILNLPADVYPPHSVASVSGMSGTGAGIGTILATYLIGRVADQTSFTPVLLVSAAMPIMAAAVVLALVREEKRP
jgi:ACS family hexuronate transporter-like MFS transporter